MPRRPLYLLKIVLVLSFLVSLLSGCGEFGEVTMKETYPLESVNKDGSQTSYIYRAANKTVPEVARELAEQKKPRQISKEDAEHMFLVYSKEWIHVQRDEQNPDDTLIEVDSEEYVRQNYSPSFLEGYLVASLIGNMFDSLGRHGDYRGYSSRDVYQPAKQYEAPTAKDKKAIPPLTVERSGSIFKRGQDHSGSSTKVGDNGNVFGKSSSGKIVKEKDGKSGFDSIFSPSKSKKPKTRVGTGKIFKRGRR